MGLKSIQWDIEVNTPTYLILRLQILDLSDTHLSSYSTSSGNRTLAFFDYPLDNLSGSTVDN